LIVEGKKGKGKKLRKGGFGAVFSLSITDMKVSGDWEQLTLILRGNS